MHDLDTPKGLYNMAQGERPGNKKISDNHYLKEIYLL